jgi:hypothetical protein
MSEMNENERFVEACRFLVRSYGEIQEHGRNAAHWCQTVGEPCYFLEEDGVLIAAGRFDLSLEVVLCPPIRPEKNYNPVVVINGIGDQRRLHEEWTRAIPIVLELLENKGQPKSQRPTVIADKDGKEIVLQDYEAEHGVGVQIGSTGHKLWVCIDGVAALRVKAPRIELEDNREEP